MTTTLLAQNGWPVGKRAALGVKNYLVDGANQHFALIPTTAPVLCAFLAEFNKLVEQINKAGTVFDDWAFNELEKIPNSNDYSNHAAACAVDVNATKHVWKNIRSGFTPVQEKQIDLLCAKYGIRWGFRYKFGWKDPMHFEIIETQAQVAARIVKMKLKMPAVMK